MSARPEPFSRTQKGAAQLVVGLLALPLSLLPFLAYGTMTPEGKLVRDRLVVKLSPPSLPTLSKAEKESASALAPSYQGGVVALAYHGIGSASDDGRGFVISPKRFAQHLAMLRAAGLNTVTATDVARAFSGGPPLPPNAVMISFDDGRTDAMLFADPLLRQARMAATMFVITGAASNSSVYYAHWASIEKYARSGRWDIQAHTSQSHHQQKAAGGQELPALTSLKPGESLDAYRDRVRADLARSDAAIKKHTGRRPVAFAYPFGAYGADRTNDPAIGKVLADEIGRRYQVAFEQDQQDSIPLLTSDQDHLLLRRLEVGKWTGSELLARIGRASRTGPLPGQGDAGAPGLQPPNPAPYLDAPPGSTGAAELVAGRSPAGSGAVGGAAGGSPGALATSAMAAASASPASGGSAPASTPSSSSGGGTGPTATTSPPTTTAPTPIPPPTSVQPGCGQSSNGKGPKKCTGGAG